MSRFLTALLVAVVIARTAGAAVAKVSTDAPLLHSRQVLADDAEAAIKQLHGILTMAGAERVVRLNVAVATLADVDAAREVVARRSPESSVTLVVGALPGGAKVGIDAVASVRSRADIAPRATAAVGILVPGPRVYVSGQAEKGDSPADATARTIAKLKGTLEFAGSSAKQIVQAKCFLTPMSAAGDVTREFEKAFGAGAFPIVFVEWKSNLPIEIELIASAAPAPPDAPAIEYLTPAGMTASPLFSRVVRVNRGEMMYLDALTSAKPQANGETQVTSVFEQLRTILTDNGSDLRHLVKATYYVSDDDASAKLNTVRPKFLDAKRPPAASKAMVPGVGVGERSVAVDMIAVPIEKPER